MAAAKPEVNPGQRGEPPKIEQLYLRHFSEDAMRGAGVRKESLLEEMLFLGQADRKKRIQEMLLKAKAKADKVKKNPEGAHQDLAAKQAKATFVPEGSALQKELASAEGIIRGVHGAADYVDPRHLTALPDAALLAVKLAELPNEMRTPDMLLGLWQDWAADIPLQNLTARARQEYFHLQDKVKAEIGNAARYHPAERIPEAVLDGVMPNEFGLSGADLMRLGRMSAEDGSREMRRQERGHGPVTDEERQWVYKREDGTVMAEISDVEEIINGETVTRDMDPLRRALRKLETHANVNDEQGINAMYDILEAALTEPNSQVQYEDIKPWAIRIKKHLEVVSNYRWTPSAAQQEIIKSDPTGRDKIFFERIKNVLRSNFEQSRQVMNLYAVSGVDNFIDAVEAQCGKTIAQHYEHMMQSIFFNHDLELTARNAAGDVEILKKLVHISHTSYMTEMTKDPLVVAMIGSYEQALRKILHDHDGVLPPKLFAFEDGRVYWDDLAMHFFKTKVESGVLRDFKKNAKGMGVPRPDSRGYELGNVFTAKDLENQELRVEAIKHIAKGISVFDHRILELFASAKAPGFETKYTAFSSIPYEGISRFFRPHGHLFGKYGMGELSHKAVFATLIGGEIPEHVNFMKWSPEDWEHVQSAISKGTLSEWLEGKYGKKLGAKIYKHATPFIEVMAEFSWTGRLGPHSAWGENDATLYFTDKQRELEGGSIRIGRAEWWAKRYLKGKYGKDEWAKMENTADGREKIKQLTRAYRAWVWAQMTLRNPQIAAENVFNTSNGIQPENKKAFDLRKVLIGRILGIDLDKLVTTEATPNAAQRAYMNRIAILDADVAAIQHAALYGGPGGKPREITEADFAILTGPATVEGTGEVIDAATRRAQAQSYIESVQKEVLGSWTDIDDDWAKKLGISVGRARVYDLKGNEVFMDDMLQIDNFENIDAILQEVEASGGRISADLLDRTQNIYMGMDDVRLEELDVGNLGERAFARLTNDLECRKTTVGKMMELLQEFKPKMDERKVLTLLEEMYRAEVAGRGPPSAQAFLYYFARLFGEYYRGGWFARTPITGKVLQRFMELSIAQKIHGKDVGEVWSINNLNDFYNKIAQIGGLPPAEIDENGVRNPYSIERLKKETVSSNHWAIAEAVIIGYALAMSLTAALAFKKAQEEDEKH